MKKTIGLLLLLIWMGVIIFTSSQTGRESHHLSQFFLHLLQTLGLSISNHLWLRKFAHATEYFFLFVLLFFCLSYFYQETTKRVIYSILMAYLFACSDEIHQYFVHGRGASFKDTLIDLTGILLAAILCVFFQIIIKKKQPSSPMSPHPSTGHSISDQ